MKNKKNLICTKLGLGILALSGLGFSGIASAAFTPAPLNITTYDPAELRSVGCDPAIMDKLNSEYIAKRGFDRQREGTILVRDQVSQAPDPTAFGGSGGRTCIESAQAAVKGVAQQVDSIMAIFNGAMDTSSVAQKVMNQVSNAACTQINNYAGQMVYGNSQGVRQVLSGVNGAVNGSVETPIGNIGIGSNIPRDNTGAVSGAVNNANQGINNNSGGWMNSIMNGVFK